MGVIQREIERAGVSTVSISLVREFTKQVRPPRALWVPFPFGRPLGSPGDPGVQRRVLDAALALFGEPEGPVLSDHVLTDDEEHLDARWQMIGRSCGPRGCSVAPADDEDVASAAHKASDREVDIGAVRAELSRLSDAHGEYRRAHGDRTQVGGSGFEPTAIDAALEIVYRYVVGDSIDAPQGTASIELYVRQCVDDLKAYYTEARIGTGATTETARDVDDWLWTETELSLLLIVVRDRILAATDEHQDPNFVLARGIVPRGYAESGYSLTHTADVNVQER